MKTKHIEIEKIYEVKNFMKAIQVKNGTPSERELDMLWGWFLVKGEMYGYKKKHLAEYIADVYSDDWYLKFKDHIKV